LEDTEELYRQIELLQRDIEQHVATETMFQSINLQLRDRLEIFQKQNKENVEKAEEELQRLGGEMNAALAQVEEVQARLQLTESENDALRRRLNEIASGEFSPSNTTSAHGRTETVAKLQAEVSQTMYGTVAQLLRLRVSVQKQRMHNMQLSNIKQS